MWTKCAHRFRCGSVEREFDAAIHAERIQLALHGIHEWFGFSELLNRHDARVERGCRFKGTCDRKAEANLVTADIESCSGEREHFAVMISGNPQTQSRVAFRKRDQTANRREAADQFNRKPVDSMQ
jgi:hypothetical protein